MEREIAVIKPKGFNHLKQAVTLTATYNLRGKDISINKYGQVKPGNLKKDRGDFRFDSGAAMTLPIFGDSYEEVEDQINFWANHPQVEDINGTPKSTSMFTIEVLEETRAKKREKSVRINRVLSTVYGMSDADRKDVMYFFKKDPRNMSDEDITLELADLENGVVTKEPNLGRFLETFGSLNNMKIAKTVEMMVYVNKGIVTGFITESEGKYYVGDVLLGKDEDDIALYFKDNPQVYENLKRSLAADGDERAFNDINGYDGEDVSPAERRRHFEAIYKKYKLKGAFPADLDRAIERIHKYEEENGIELSQ